VLLTAAALEITALVVQCVTAAAALTLAFVGLRINAKPGIRVRVTRDGGPVGDGGPVVFGPAKEGVVSIYVELRGFFYGKPTASDMKLTLNVDESWILKRLCWNAPGQSESHDVAKGKGLKPGPWWRVWRSVPGTDPSNFLVAEHLWLTRDEKGEALEATLLAPDKPGHYFCWIHASAREGDCGVHVFDLLCQ
jgi:hypothetical protein